jgi:hypothetical protein
MNHPIVPAAWIDIGMSDPLLRIPRALDEVCRFNTGDP